MEFSILSGCGKKASNYLAADGLRLTPMQNKWFIGSAFAAQLMLSAACSD
jgi:hypothetical protein